MFESGRALFNPNTTDRVTSRVALWFYGIYLVLGLVADVNVIWKYGMTRPIHLAIYTAVFFMSLTCLRTTIKSGPPTGGRFGIHVSILVILGVLVPSILYDLSH
jgi:hypothetical protein